MTGRDGLPGVPGPNLHFSLAGLQLYACWMPGCWVPCMPRSPGPRYQRGTRNTLDPGDIWTGTSRCRSILGPLEYGIQSPILLFLRPSYFSYHRRCHHHHDTRPPIDHQGTAARSYAASAFCPLRSCRCRFWPPRDWDGRDLCVVCACACATAVSGCQQHYVSCCWLCILHLLFGAFPCRRFHQQTCFSFGGS